MAHQVGSNRIATNGGQVTTGYKPDLTIQSQNNDVVFIVESEQETDRKAFLGDYIKAEKYSQENNYNPMLIIVMQVFPNTTVQQIASHLEPYLTWFNNGFGNAAKIKNILIMSDTEYQSSSVANQVIGSQQFISRGILLTHPNKANAADPKKRR